MKNKILGWLFLAYRDPNKPIFASRWMHRHGKWLIGDPSPIFMERDIHPELIRTYYFTKDDRHLDAARLKKWRTDSVFVNTYRRYQEQVVAVATAIASLSLCMVALLPLAPIHMSKAGLSAIGSFGCEAYMEDIATGEITWERVDRERYSKCIEAASKGGGK